MPTKLGKITINEVHIYEFDEPPFLNGGYQAPLGSLGLVKAGVARIYQKFGTGASDWKVSEGSQSIFSVSNSDILTNINIDTTPDFQTQIPITGTVDIPSVDFTVVGNLIRANFSGKIVVNATLQLISANSNAEVFVRLGKNLTTFFGNSNSFKQAFANRPTLLTGVIDVAENDTIGIFSERQANAGEVTMNQIGESRLEVVRI